MSKQETVEVTLKLPKAIVDYLREDEKSIEETLAHEIVDVVRQDVEACTGEDVAEILNLTSIFKEYGMWANKRMSKQEYVEIPIPAEEYDELTKVTKELGYESVDSFVEEAFRKHLETLKCEAGEK